MVDESGQFSLSRRPPVNQSRLLEINRFSLKIVKFWFDLVVVSMPY